MAFTIPSISTATYPNQSHLFKTDVDILVQGYNGEGVASGCAVTAQGTPDMTCAVASGSARIGGATVSVSSGNVTVTAANASNDRIDLVVVNNSGTKSVVAGTAAATPVQPAVPANSVALAQVYMPAGATSVTSSQIVDKRVIVLTSPASAGIAVEEDGSEEGATITRLNFTTGLDVSVSGGEATVSVSGAAAPNLLHVRDEKAQNTVGGGFTSGAWQTRTLNTVKTNEITGASLSSNEVTLPAGTYEIDALAPAYAVARHQARLYNVTGAAVLLDGTSMYADPGDVNTVSFVRGRFTLASTSAVRLEHRCGTTNGTNGLGIAANFATEVYADVMIREVG